MKTAHLNPQKITCFKRDSRYIETIEQPFNILEWVSPYLVAEFGEDLVLTAIGSLNLVFGDLTTYTTIDDRGNFDFALKYLKTHHINHTSNERKFDGGEKGTGNYINFTRYHLTIPSNLKDGDIIQFCLLNNYPFLKEFKHKSSEKVQMLPMQTSFVMLKDIPEELRGKTVNELIEMNKPFTIEKMVYSLTCYTPHSKGMEDYELYLELKNGSLYIPYAALKNSDFSLIENRMKKYFSDYYRNNPEQLKKSLRLLKTKEAAKLKECLSKNLQLA